MEAKKGEIMEKSVNRKRKNLNRVYIVNYSDNDSKGVENSIGASKSGLVNFQCSLCPSTSFSCLRSVVKHIESLHRDGLLSLFFPNVKKFETWLSNLEDLSGANFSCYQWQEKKQFYLCTTELRIQQTTKHKQCPSMIIAQEYEHGLQVFFLPNHHGHMVKKYNPHTDDKINKYILTKFNYPHLILPKLAPRTESPQKVVIPQMVVLPQQIPIQLVLNIDPPADVKLQKYKDFSAMLEKIMKYYQDLDADDFDKVFDLANSMSQIMDETFNKRKHALIIPIGSESTTKNSNTTTPSNTPIKQEKTSPVCTKTLDLPNLSDVVDLGDTEIEIKEVVWNKRRKKSPDFNDQYKTFVEGEIKRKLCCNVSERRRRAGCFNQIVPTVNKSYKQNESKTVDTSSAQSTDVDSDFSQNEPKINTRSGLRSNSKVIEIDRGVIKDPNFRRYIRPTRGSSKSKDADDRQKSDVNSADFKDYEVRQRENDCNILILKI